MGAADVPDRVVPRLNYRVGEVCRMAGCSRWKVRQKIEKGEIRWRRDGRDVYLHPDDVERVFGFPNDDAVETTSTIALDILTKLQE